MKIRPPWVSASLKPDDLDKSFYAFLHGANPNDPKLPKSALVYHNKWGIVRKNHEKALGKSHDFDLGLGSAHRKDGHRLMTVRSRVLSLLIFKLESINFENFHCFREFLNIISISEGIETTKFEYRLIL